MEERLVEFETPWSERLANWNKFKPFARWYHRNKSNLWAFQGNSNFRLRVFNLGKVPKTYIDVLGRRIRDPQKATRKQVITEVQVPKGNEEVEVVENRCWP